MNVVTVDVILKFGLAIFPGDVPPDSAWALSATTDTYVSAIQGTCMSPMNKWTTTGWFLQRGLATRRGNNVTPYGSVWTTQGGGSFDLPLKISLIIPGICVLPEHQPEAL